MSFTGPRVSAFESVDCTGSTKKGLVLLRLVGDVAGWFNCGCDCLERGYSIEVEVRQAKRGDVVNWKT